MGQADARIAGGGEADSLHPNGQTRPGIVGYAKQLSHPAYERLLSSEEFLRRLVPVLIIIFLMIVALVRWVQINSLGQQIIDANKAELHFIAELVEARISNQLLKAPEMMGEMELENLINDNVPARYIKRDRHVVLSDRDGIIRATMPRESHFYGRHISSIFTGSSMISQMGVTLEADNVMVAETQPALGVHRLLPTPFGGITVYQPTGPMMENWRKTVSTNVSLFVGTASILIVILYAYFAQSARAREADEIYSTTNTGLSQLCCAASVACGTGTCPAAMFTGRIRCIRCWAANRERTSSVSVKSPTWSTPMIRTCIPWQTWFWSRMPRRSTRCSACSIWTGYGFGSGSGPRWFTTNTASRILSA